MHNCTFNAGKFWWQIALSSMHTLGARVLIIRGSYGPWYACYFVFVIYCCYHLSLFIICVGVAYVAANVIAILVVFRLRFCFTVQNNTLISLLYVYYAQWADLHRASTLIMCCNLRVFESFVCRLCYFYCCIVAGKLCFRFCGAVANFQLKFMNILMTMLLIP